MQEAAVVSEAQMFAIDFQERPRPGPETQTAGWGEAACCDDDWGWPSTGQKYRSAVESRFEIEAEVKSKPSMLKNKMNKIK